MSEAAAGPGALPLESEARRRGAPGGGAPAPAASSGSLLTRLTAIATLGGFLFGYDTAVISGAISALDANFIAPRHLDEIAASSLSGWMISCALLGCVIGASGAGWAATRLGRRGGLMLAAALFLVSAVGTAYPEIGFSHPGGLGAAALTPFVIYRILCGVAIGIASMLSPLYIAEIAPSAVRGRLVSFNQLSIVVGILIAFVANYGIAAMGDTSWLHSVGWRLMLGSEAVPALLFLVLLIGVPDTPRWYVQRGQVEKARDVLFRLEPRTAETTLRDMQLTRPERTSPLFSYGRTVVIAGITLSVFQQAVGINAVLYYAPLIFKNLGASTDNALLQTVVVGLANLIFTFVAIATVDKVGRRSLLIAGGAVMAVAMFALGTLFAQQAVGLWALVAVVVYIAGFAFSWGPVTWVLLSEMFPGGIKARAMAIAVAAQWIANFVVTWSFKVIDGNSTLNDLFHHGFAYWMYAGLSVLAAAFVWKWVPETTGKSLEAIEALWKPAGGRG
jgi:SP family xylose:H+ symportor-like MFS transporter